MKRPAVRYHGGKWRLAPWIISHFPQHRCYVEPFGGGASVLLRKPRSHAEVYNDLWGDIVNVFRVLRDQPDALRRLLQLTPFSRDEFEATSECSDDPVEQARRTIFRSFAGFNSAAINVRYATGFRGNGEIRGTSPAMDWKNYPNEVMGFSERLRGVVIENRPAFDVMKQHDGPDTLHYVDPPYVHDTRNMKRGNAAYECEMSDDDHRQLLNFLSTLDGMVVLSGYQNDIYDGLGWERIDVNAKADGARDRIESLWLNPAAGQFGQQRMSL